MIEPFKNSVGDVAKCVNDGTYPCQDVAQFYFQRIKRFNHKLNAWLSWDQIDLEKQIVDLQAKLKSKTNLPLAGVTVAVKDNICVEDYPNTCGSKILENFKSIYDATVISKLRRAGAIILGKTNMDEFGMGSSNENSAFGPVNNPWNLEYVAGGSSGGSAAAVASDTALVALGSDTGGSVRLPASFCGLVGFKPTYGHVSRYGLTAYASSLDQIGPIGRSVDDVRRIYQVISGDDENDSTALFIQKPNKNLADKKIRVGMIKELCSGTNPGVLFQLQETLKKISKEFEIEIEEVSLPNLRYGVSAYYIIAPAEASANLARYDGVRFGLRESSQSLNKMYLATRTTGFGKEVKQRIMLGTYVLSAGYYDAYYRKAVGVRQQITHDFDKAFGNIDFLVSPTYGSPVFKIGQKTDPLAMYVDDLCTVSANLSGVPAISIPIGVDEMGMPVGLQIMACRHNDDHLLDFAEKIERVIPVIHVIPQFVG